jgi:hypothetical protein
MKSRIWTGLLLLALAFAIAPAAMAQLDLDPGQLPKSTMFYVAWHGALAGEVRKSNSLLALWDDSDFAPVRAAMLDEMLRGSAESKTAPVPLSKEDLAEYVSLLDNEFVAGYISDPNPKKMGDAAGDSHGTKWNGGFLVYDRTGKEATLAKLLLRARTSEKDASKISTATLAGISAIKVERTRGTSYWAEDGKYAFSASEPAVFEQIAAWARRRTPVASGLSQTAAYREATDIFKGGAVEVYFHFPGIRELTSDTSAGGFRIRPFLQSLKLEAVHSIVGSVSLEGARTRFQGAVLGEASPGTLFDIWDEGSATPETWKFVNANTVSYYESRVNLLGIYALIKRALQSTSGAGQQGPLDFVETAAAARLGMPLPEALALFSGEFATLQTSAALDPAKQVYFFGIRKKPETLKLLRAALADRVTAERSEGDTTFFKVSEGGLEGSTGTASWKYYHLGVTNDVIAISRRSESVREAVATRRATPGNNLTGPQALQSVRPKYPANINGLSFMDFQKIDWTAAKERWNAESRRASATAGTNQKVQQRAFADKLKDLDPQVLARHLHFTAGASWKDAQGLHFDGWIE